MSRYALVDVANLFYRARHVVRGDAFTKAGMALHIVFRALRKLYRENHCDHVVLCLEGHSWRYDVYPQYKARRRLERATQKPQDKEEDEVFLSTLEDFVKFMSEKTRVTVLQSSGIEGDDFVARWIQIHPNDDHIILSGDSDFVQLLAPNVQIFDGVNGRLITHEGIFDDKMQPMVFSVSPKDGKLKIGDTIADAEKKHNKEQKEKAKRIEGYEPTPFEFVPEADWCKKALFVKIVRGDTGDGIFSAYPGVRFDGTAKKIGIRECWDDRSSKGFSWNNFMLQSWEKLVGVDDKGNNIVKMVRVIDEYNFNESLINLTMQPQKIKDLMDEVIVQAVQKEPVGNVGIHFMQFCSRNSLNNLTKESTDHAKYLNAPYR